MLTLYYFPLSTCSQKVRLCQTYKGIALVERLIDLARLEQLEPSYLALNPRAEVPTLVAEEQVLTETIVINEYLDERFHETPLMPREPKLRAQVRMWARYVDTEVTTALAQPTFQYW